jgi:hypothetical protein
MNGGVVSDGDAVEGPRAGSAGQLPHLNMLHLTTIHTDRSRIDHKKRFLAFLDNGVSHSLKCTGSRPGHVHWIFTPPPIFVKLASRMTTFSARPRTRRSRSTRVPRKPPRALRPKPPRPSQRKSQKRVSKQSPLSFVYVGNVSLLAIIRPLEVVLISRVAEVGCPSRGP